MSYQAPIVATNKMSWSSSLENLHNAPYDKPSRPRAFHFHSIRGRFQRVNAGFPLELLSTSAF